MNTGTKVYIEHRAANGLIERERGTVTKATSTRVTVLFDASANPRVYSVRADGRYVQVGFDGSHSSNVLCESVN